MIRTNRQRLHPQARSRSFVGRILSLIAIAALMPSVASAFGVGGYFEFLHGDGDLDAGTSLVPNPSFETDKFGFGVVIDTNLARNRVFNYRAALGYQHSERHFDTMRLGGVDFDPGEIDGHGVAFNNAFGFGLSRGPDHRLWAGPSFRFGVDVYNGGAK